MKKICYLLICILLMIPISLNASIMKNYSEAYIYANNYINKYSTRERYLINNSSNMLSKNEFLTSIRGNKTYLVDGKEYWTNTEDNNDSNKQFYISSKLSSKLKTLKSGARVTQLVRNNTMVKGNGTYNTPWEFVDSYIINIAKNLNVSDISVSVEPTSVIAGGSATVKVKETLAYMYTGKDDCNLKNGTRNGYETTYTLSNIKKDINCVARFEKRAIKVEYKCAPGSGSITTQTVLYGNSFNVNNGGCTKAGYSHIKWKSNDNKEYNFNQSVVFNETLSGIVDNKITLTAVYKDETAPTIRIVAEEQNVSSNVLQAQAEFKPTAGTNNYTNTYKIKGDDWFNKKVTLKADVIDGSEIKSVVARWNGASSATETSVSATNHSLTCTKNANGCSFTQNITSEGFRVLEFEVTDEYDNKSIITVKAKIDLTNPTCALKYNNNNVTFNTKNDTLSGLIGYDLTSSSIPTFNSNTTMAFVSRTTFYGHVKDKANNTSNCTYLINFTPHYRINDELYETLRTAFSGAKNSGDTIYLLDNYSDASTASTDKTVILDLNKKTLTRTAKITSSGGSLTVKNGSLTSTDIGIESSGGNLVLNGAKIQADGYGLYVSKGNGTINTSNISYIYSTKNTPIYLNNTGGDIVIDSTYIYTPVKNKTCIRIGTKSGINITIKGNSYVGMGYVNEDGEGDGDGQSPTYKNTTPIYLGGGKATLNVEGYTKIFAGKYARCGIEFWSKNNVLNLTGNSSIYVNNSAMHDVWTEKSSSTGNSVTFDSSGEFYAKGTRVLGGDASVKLSVKKGHFAANNSDKYMMNNHGTYTIKATEKIKKTFYAMNSYNSLESSNETIYYKDYGF